MSNQVGLTLFGYEHLDEVTGKNIVDFIAPDDRPRAAEAFQSILTTGGLKDFDMSGTQEGWQHFLCRI
jgi:PAS domain-containing protein